MYEFQLIEYKHIDKKEFYSYSRKPVFTTFEWMNYIQEDSDAKPAIIRVTKGGIFVGYVPLMFVKKYGIKIPYGASNKVTEFAKKFVKKYGFDELDKIVKKNFANYKELTKLL